MSWKLERLELVRKSMWRGYTSLVTSVASSALHIRREHGQIPCRTSPLSLSLSLSGAMPARTRSRALIELQIFPSHSIPLAPHSYFFCSSSIGSDQCAQHSAGCRQTGQLKRTCADDNTGVTTRATLTTWASRSDCPPSAPTITSCEMNLIHAKQTLEPREVSHFVTTAW